MFSFLGELIGLVAWLLQRGSLFLRSVFTATPAWLEARGALTQGIGSCNSLCSARAAHRLAIGPPRAWFALLSGDPDWPLRLATVSIPSRRFIRG